MPPGGFHGRVLHVDLTTGTHHVEPLEERVLRQTIGGVGLGTWLLLQSGAAECDPLAPEASVVFALSPLVGTPLTTSAKFAVLSKSPLTHRINDALSSDHFAIEMKRCGYDAVVLRGSAPALTTLHLDGDQVTFHDAEPLRGLSAEEAEERLRTTHGKPWRFFGIGPAGEAQVLYATASGNGRHAGRGGTGAVFGAKRLKGVLVRGRGHVPLHNADAVTALGKELSTRSLGAATSKYRELGTIANVLTMNRLGALPTRNFSEGHFEGADAVSGEAFHEQPEKMRAHCAACTIGCEHVFKTKRGQGVRLEYEGLFALGPLCGIDDREIILEAAALCDALGLDVISAGGVVAFAMECAEERLLPDAPRFGDGAGLLALLRAIGAREGLGDLLADGVRAAARRLGRGAERFACHVKGLELPGYEPRALQAMAVGLATGARGADHNRSGAYEEDFRAGGDRLRADASKGEAAARSERRAALLDSLILCKFLRGVFEDLEAEAASMLAAVTGWNLDAAELREVAKRTVNARALFNRRAGWTPEEDTLPARFLTESLEVGSTKAALSDHDLKRMIVGYYRAQGWSDEGAIPAAVIEALDLTDLATAGAPPR